MSSSYIENWNLLVAQHSEFYNQPENKIQNLWEIYFSELFGFKKILNEIETQRKLHIGSTDREIPDIILKKDDKDLFIVELKQYSLTRNDDFEKQLLNYMSHTDLRLSIGILVCKNLYLYYYNHSDNKNDCIEIPFKKDNELGIKFMELFNKNNFDVENAKKIIQSESKNKNNISNIKKEISAELVKQVLMEHFTKTYNKDIVESAIKDFSFYCSERKKENSEIFEETIQHTENSSYNKNEISPEIVLLIGDRIVKAEEFKYKLLQVKSAKRFWYYKNGKVKEDVWHAYSFNVDSPLLANIRSTKYRDWKTSGLIKLVCKI